MAKYEHHVEIIRKSLDNRVLLLEHVGSTSVPGLAAKPIVDIDLVVADSSDEKSYVPALVEAGYVLRIREPDWQEHRMFRTPDLDVHLHVFSPESSEVERHLRFRNRLREAAEDRELYEGVKRRLAEKEWKDMNDYADAKTEVIESILAKTQ